MHTQPTELDLADPIDPIDLDALDVLDILDILDPLPFNHVPHLRLNEGSYLTLPTWSDRSDQLLT